MSSIASKAEIRRIAHLEGKKVSKNFYVWFEKKCERLLETAIQASGLGNTITAKDTDNLLRAMGKL